MALMRAPCSEAAFSRSARKIWTVRLRGRSVVEDLALVGLVVVDRVAAAAARRCSISAGMICCAVGIWEITDLKRE